MAKMEKRAARKARFPVRLKDDKKCECTVWDSCLLVSDSKNRVQHGWRHRMKLFRNVLRSVLYPTLPGLLCQLLLGYRASLHIARHQVAVFPGRDP